MFLNNRIDSKKSLQLGLLNLLFEKNFDSLLKETITNLSTQSMTALKYIKHNIKLSKNNSLNKAFKYEAKNLIKCSQTEEHRIAVSNFKKKK
mgnify:FL=1